MAAGRKARVDLEPRGLRIVVRSRVRRTGITFAAVFLVFWVGFWTKSIVDELADGQTSDIVVSAILLSAGAAMLLPSVLWVLAGKEEILVTPAELALRARIGPFSRSRRFAAAEIDSLTAVDPHVPSRAELAGEHPGARPGLYGAVRLVAGGEERVFAEVGYEEAQDLVRRICDQLGRPAQ